MIVEYVHGNAISLFLSGKYQMFAHGCNIFNRMGSGIAKEVRNRLPELWQLDQLTTEGDRKKLGTISGSPIACGDQHGVAFNMYTQATFWDPADMLSYDAVRACFAEVNTLCQETVDFGLRPTMCIPMIGAGLAQGDWDKISAIINEVTPNIDITVVEFDGSR